jgi:hypothetical protein
MIAEEFVVNIPPPCNLTDADDREVLAALWFDAATLGYAIDYPQSKFELICYHLTRSRYNISVFTFVLLLHSSLPFFEPPICPWSMNNKGEELQLDYTGNGRYMSFQMSRTISLFCVLFYVVDIMLRFIVNWSGYHGSKGVDAKRHYKDKWVLWRLACVLAMLVETVAFFTTKTPFRFTRSLVPVLYITV